MRPDMSNQKECWLLETVIEWTEPLLPDGLVEEKSGRSLLMPANLLVQISMVIVNVT